MGTISMRLNAFDIRITDGLTVSLGGRETWSSSRYFEVFDSKW